MNWQAVREEFPALANWTYLNTATYGQLPRRSAAAMAAHVERRNEQACSDFVRWFDDMDRVRASAARLIHASADDIAFIPNACTALSLLVSGIEWRAGDRAVTLTGEFPNLLYGVGRLEEAGVEVIECRWDELYGSIDERTRLVAISSTNYSTGFVPPLAELGSFLRKRGVLFFIDGTQSAGALLFDVREVRPDLFAAHGYKWLISPTGAGFAYVSPELRSHLRPQVVGWRSDRNWRNVDRLHHGEPDLPASAEKYEGGMIPFTLLHAMGASLDFLDEIGAEKIEQRVLVLAGRVRDGLRGMGYEVNADRSPIVTATRPGIEMDRVTEKLLKRRVVVAARHGRLRISPHFYNDESDVEALLQELRRIS